MVRSFEAESREAQPLSSANKSRGQPHVIPPDFHAPGPPTPRPLPSDGPRRPGVVRRLSVTWSTLVLAGDVAREGGGGVVRSPLATWTKFRPRFAPNPQERRVVRATERVTGSARGG